jgi:hypothetical protein
LGGAATATAAPLLNDLQANLSKTLKQAGASDEVADGIAQGISTVTAAGIGARVGMASGNGLAGAAAGVNVDANNRQLHVSTFVRLKEKCQGASSIECQTINRMGGISSGMPTEDPKIPASKVVENYDANGKVVSYTLIDRMTNQPTMIMEPLEFDAYRNSSPGTQAMMQLSPQYALDFASAGLYVVAGENSRAVEHLTAGVTSRDYVRDVGLGIAGAAISTTIGVRPAGIASDTVEAMSKAANTADRGGLSAAGRALQKHGNREGSAFPSPQGNTSLINQQGQQVVEEILNNSSSIVIERNTGRFGRVTDIVAPDGRGLRYDKSGKFIGFLEPPKK